MTFGEIGCFLSHHTIWERVSNDHSICATVADYCVLIVMGSQYHLICFTMNKFQVAVSLTHATQTCCLKNQTIPFCSTGCTTCFLCSLATDSFCDKWSGLVLEIMLFVAPLVFIQHFIRSLFVFVFFRWCQRNYRRCSSWRMMWTLNPISVMTWSRC